MHFLLVGQRKRCLLRAVKRFDIVIKRKRSMQPLHIMRAEQIHKAAVHRLWVVVILPEQEVTQLECGFLTKCKIYYRRAERIVHHRIERVAESVVSHPAVTVFRHGILPDLTDDDAVGLFGLGSITDKAQNLVRQLVCNIYPPAGSTEPQPAAHYAVLAAYYIVLP